MTRVPVLSTVHPPAPSDPLPPPALYSMTVQVCGLWKPSLTLFRSFLSRPHPLFHPRLSPPPLTGSSLPPYVALRPHDALRGIPRGRRVIPHGRHADRRRGRGGTPGRAVHAGVPHRRRDGAPLPAFPVLSLHGRAASARRSVRPSSCGFSELSPTRAAPQSAPYQPLNHAPIAPGHRPPFELADGSSPEATACTVLPLPTCPSQVQFLQPRSTLRSAPSFVIQPGTSMYASVSTFDRQDIKREAHRTIIQYSSPCHHIHVEQECTFTVMQWLVSVLTNNKTDRE